MEEIFMGKTIYKTDYFNFHWILLVLKGSKLFNEQLQKAIDKNAEDGWKLHSWHISGFGEFCSLVFYKEED